MTKYERDYAAKKGKVAKNYQPKHLRTEAIRKAPEASRGDCVQSGGQVKEEKEEEIEVDFTHYGKTVLLTDNVVLKEPTKPKRKPKAKRHNPKTKPVPKAKSNKSTRVTHSQANPE